jgi:hypothetical protein
MKDLGLFAKSLEGSYFFSNRVIPPVEDTTGGGADK